MYRIAKIEYISELSKYFGYILIIKLILYMKRFDLREFRRDKRVTQSELAELFQCKQNFISRIENGERTLPPEKLDILQDKYGDISKYYKEVSDTDEHMTINASPQEFINAGADAFTRQLVKMMNEKLIAPYSALLEKDMIIERLNREIGRLEMQLEDAKKDSARQDGDAASAVAG